MRLKTAALLMTCLLLVVFTHALASPQTSGPLTNKDIIQLKGAGITDDVIILRIKSGPTNFSIATDDIIALKSAQVSDAVIAEMLKSSANSSNSAGGSSGRLDLSKGVLVRPFSSTISDPAAAGLPDATRTAVVNILKTNEKFSAAGTLEESKDGTSWIEISAELVDFAGGNVAKRMLIGLGSGRAHAGFSITVKESATGKILWKKTIKETASFWSNSASSSAQRSELPEKVAKSFVEQLVKAKIPDTTKK